MLINLGRNGDDQAVAVYTIFKQFFYTLRVILGEMMDSADYPSFRAGTAADNAVAESEVENGIAGAPMVSNVRDKGKSVSWDLELSNMGNASVSTEPKVFCCIKVLHHVTRCFDACIISLCTKCSLIC